MVVVVVEVVVVVVMVVVCWWGRDGDAADIMVDSRLR